MLPFLQLHYSENISLQDIASSTSICERECLRSFRKVLKQSPIQYLIHYRIAQACRMLKEGSKGITQIGEACGFSSPSYFTKTFRRIMGCTPSEYAKRKNMEQKVLHFLLV